MTPRVGPTPPTLMRSGYAPSVPSSVVPPMRDLSSTVPTATIMNGNGYGAQPEQARMGMRPPQELPVQTHITYQEPQQRVSYFNA